MLDHADDLAAESAVDIAGDYAWLEVGTFGNYEASVEFARRSHALAEAAGVRTSPWAWIALAQSELYTGRFDDSLRDSEKAFHHADELGLAAEAVTLSACRWYCSTSLVSAGAARQPRPMRSIGQNNRAIRS